MKSDINIFKWRNKWIISCSIFHARQSHRLQFVFLALFIINHLHWRSIILTRHVERPFHYPPRFIFNVKVKLVFIIFWEWRKQERLFLKHLDHILCPVHYKKSKNVLKILISYTVLWKYIWSLDSNRLLIIFIVFSKSLNVILVIPFMIAADDHFPYNRVAGGLWKKPSSSFLFLNAKPQHREYPEHLFDNCSLKLFIFALGSVITIYCILH